MMMYVLYAEKTFEQTSYTFFLFNGKIKMYMVMFYDDPPICTFAFVWY
jgi:hypothetical protein